MLTHATVAQAPVVSVSLEFGEEVVKGVVDQGMADSVSNVREDGGGGVEPSSARLRKVVG